MVTEGKGLSARFLDAFNRIDKALRASTKLHDRTTGFVAVVRMAAAGSSVVKHFRDDLVEYADLRNAIVHESTDGHAIAEPHPQTVQHLERICDVILSPQKLYPTLSKKVQTCSASDTVLSIAKVMLEKDFSQLPVEQDGKFLGVLTVQTVARWLGSCAAGEMATCKSVVARDVLKFREKTEKWDFLKKTDTVFDALERFSDHAQRGQTLVAILITETGKPSETLLGILTVYDISNLLRATTNL